MLINFIGTNFNEFWESLYPYLYAYFRWFFIFQVRYVWAVKKNKLKLLNSLCYFTLTNAENLEYNTNLKSIPKLYRFDAIINKNYIFQLIWYYQFFLIYNAKYTWPKKLLLCVWKNWIVYQVQTWNKIECIFYSY